MDWGRVQHALIRRAEFRGGTADDIKCKMNTAAKRMDAIRANPAADWQIGDLEVVARSMGVSVRSGGGSHFVFSHPAVAMRITVPARRPIKPIYIVKFLEFVDKIRGAQ